MGLFYTNLKHERKLALVSMTQASLLIVAFLGLSACQDPESLRVSCDSGDATGCYDLGLLYGAGAGVTQDLARAVSLFQQACEGGQMVGCATLGLLYETGEGVTQDVARAFSLYQQACEGGNMRGCLNLGAMYQVGSVVSQDLARAVSLYQQACDGADIWAATASRSWSSLARASLRTWRVPSASTSKPATAG